MLNINKLKVRKTYDVTFTIEDQEEITIPHTYLGKKLFKCNWSRCHLDLNEDKLHHYDEQYNISNIVKYSINKEN